MGVQKRTQGILLLGRREPSWPVILFNPMAELSHIPPHLLPLTRGDLAQGLKESGRSCCDSFFWYLRDSSILQGWHWPKELLCSLMDGFFFFFFSTYFATFNSWESRDHELVTSAATWSRQSWRRCKTVEWTDFPVTCLQGISVPSRLWEQELCVWINFVFHYCHFYLLLTFLWHEPFSLIPYDSSIHIAKTPQEPITLHLLQSSLHKGTNSWLSWKR